MLAVIRWPAKGGVPGHVQKQQEGQSAIKLTALAALIVFKSEYHLYSVAICVVFVVGAGWPGS